MVICMASAQPIGFQVRDALFRAPSRTYAEQYLEPFVRAKYALFPPESDDHDATDSSRRRYEIKAARVLRETDNGKGSRSLLERILYMSEDPAVSRLVPFSEAKTARYLANIQNVKRDHFDTLIYLLLFEDCMKIFFAESDSIQHQTFPRWSDKHGRYDALGKSGQFGITSSSIQFHLDNNLRDSVSYHEMAEVYRVLSE